MEEEIYKQQHDIINRIEEFITQSSLSSSNDRAYEILEERTRLTLCLAIYNRLRTVVYWMLCAKSRRWANRGARSMKSRKRKRGKNIRCFDA